jgi:hypothetical protein
MGVCTLVRPQSLVIAPAFGWLALAPRASWRKRLLAATGVAAVAVMTCQPWVLRNELRMGHAALSFNGGWNLLIGTNPAGGGSWSPVEVPRACREVFQEAEKDLCFAREAGRRIAANPTSWLRLVPAKLSVTFDYCGGAGWYLHQANARAFSYDWKLRVGVVETLFERAALLGALVFTGLAKGPRRKARMALAALCAIPVFLHQGWIAYLGLAVVAALFGRALEKLPVLVGATLAMVVSTAAIHAVFFGSGRYSMVLFPFVTALACGLLTRGNQQGHTANLEGDLVDAPH